MYTLRIILRCSWADLSQSFTCVLVMCYDLDFLLLFILSVCYLITWLPQFLSVCLLCSSLMCEWLCTYGQIAHVWVSKMLLPVPWWNAKSLIWTIITTLSLCNTHARVKVGVRIWNITTVNLINEGTMSFCLEVSRLLTTFFSAHCITMVIL